MYDFGVTAEPPLGVTGEHDDDEEGEDAATVVGFCGCEHTIL